MQNKRDQTAPLNTKCVLIILYVFYFGLLFRDLFENTALLEYLHIYSICSSSLTHLHQLLNLSAKIHVLCTPNLSPASPKVMKLRISGDLGQAHGCLDI